MSNQDRRVERPAAAGRAGGGRRRRFAVLAGLLSRCANVWHRALRVLRRDKRAERLIMCVGVVLGLALIVVIANVLAGAGPSQAAPRRATLSRPAVLYASGTSDGAVLLSWQPSQPPPVGYRIYRATGRHGPYTILGEVMAPDMDTFTDSSDLMPGTTYAYTVTAFDRQGESAPVGPIIALVLSTPAPTPTVAGPTPLPTFAAPTSPTLTAIARSSRQVKRPTPRSGTRAGPGATMGANTPAGTAGLPTPVPTVAPSSGVGTVPHLSNRDV
jgi:Fibronectin type III domain